MKLPVEPGARHSPVSFYGPDRHVQMGCDLFDLEPAEESHFNNLRLSAVPGGKPFQGFVQCQDLLGLIVGIDQRRVQFYLLSFTLLRVDAPGMIDQHASHGSCRNGDEVPAVLPLYILASADAEISFMDESSRLKRVIFPFSIEIIPGQTPEIFI